MASRLDSNKLKLSIHYFFILFIYFVHLILTLFYTLSNNLSSACAHARSHTQHTRGISLKVKSMIIFFCLFVGGVYFTMNLHRELNPLLKYQDLKKKSVI